MVVVLSFFRVFVILFYLSEPYDTFEENPHDQTVSVHQGKVCGYDTLLQDGRFL